jgi:dipeptidyl aminopeptidase/acylaminoacyl peptidase
MANKKAMSIDDLWEIQRIGSVSVAPDGARAVVAVTEYAMDENKSVSSLWLLATRGGAPRKLTWCGDKDGQPQWSPKGDLIAFTGNREQQGSKDDASQLYVIAPDGGEARRVSVVATGVDAFRWFPDGRRIAFVSWVWPELSSAREQAKRHKAFKERKETAYVTSEAQYRFWDRNLPMGRVPHLHVVDVGAKSAKARDLFSASGYELSRASPGAETFDISPDGSRIVFAFDPAPEKRLDNRFALAEIDVDTARVRVVCRDPEWDFGAPRYSPDAARVAFIASHQGRKHTMPGQLAILERTSGRWKVVSSAWDHDVAAPLIWSGDDSILLRAEHHGRTPLWRFDLAAQNAETVVRGGTVLSFDAVGDMLVTVADSALHPARVHAQFGDSTAKRLERFNDARLARFDLGTCEELWFQGARSDGRAADDVQMWLTYPPGFDPRRKYPLLHVIHGGPHGAAGDTWHYRWNSVVFAAQGYVVAAVNYHGSSGFGYAFLDSITHRWGELELQDIEAATDLLLEKPWADRRRVFASGGSYGGYMVAWMNGHVPPGRYAAYVCHAGCYDWVAMFAEDAYTWFPRELGASYWDDMAKVLAQSPHAFAGEMQTPTLVIHGAMDYRVPDQQGLAYYNTLKARGIAARLVWFPDENHWVLKPRNSRLWYREFFAWLTAYDPGRKRTVPRPGGAARKRASSKPASPTPAALEDQREQNDQGNGDAQEPQQQELHTRSPP